MKHRYFKISLVIISILYACKDKTNDNKIEVKLVSIGIVDTPPPVPPPPPPISNTMTFNDWLVKISQTETPEKTIVAYNFGLFETENGYTVYLIGSKEFDKDDSDWALNHDFEPKLKYYPLPEKIYKSLKWEEVLMKVKSQLIDFKKSFHFKKSFFSKAKAITVGFDDGDLERIK